VSLPSPASFAMNLLYVEDDPEAREFVRGALVGSGISVDVAEDGRSGFACVADRTYDLLLLDVSLPDESGFDLLRRIRALGVDSAVIFLTAQSEVARRVEGLELGADDYVSKPFAFAELLARIRAVMRRRLQQPDDGVLSVGDLEIDLNVRRVVRAGREIPLTPKEFALLEYLVENVGHPVSRSMLIEKIWGHGFGARDNVIDVHMTRLRNKIDRGFDATLIRTIRGVGYTVEPPREDRS
jgi:two-component system OmpR family response regulator